MASSLSNYLKSALVNHIFRTTKYTAPTNIYFALYTSAPTAAGGGTEVSGGSYARKYLAVADASFDAPSNGASQNSIAITFDVPTANWGTIVAMGMFDALTEGNFLGFADLTVSKTVSLGDGAPSFPIGDLDIQI